MIQKSINIGPLVKDTMIEISKIGLTEEEIIKLQDKEYSKEIFNLNCPFMKKASNDLSLRSKMKNEDYGRYWNELFDFNGEKYFITSEWYEKENMSYFESWLKDKKTGKSDNHIVNQIMSLPDLNPDKHDGSYDLVREAVESLSKSNINVLGIDDLDMLYSMSVGTWRMSIDIKIKRIEKSKLLDEEKIRLESVVDMIKKNAENHKYENREKDGPSVGMFGTGFFTFKGNTTDEEARKFISLVIRIKDLTDEDEIFNILEEGFKDGINGIQSGSASMILHCLKPTIFPIITGRVIKSIVVLENAGVILNKPNLLTNYIENTKILREFRDKNCKFKNYRVLDIGIWDIGRIIPIVSVGPIEVIKIIEPIKPIKFNNPLDFGNLYFSDEEVLKTQISIALKSGKSIILIGPPGTGKSKIAKKIVESYGADSKMVTAMSDWSSYDTIGGYKPNADGSLYFEEGIFLSSFKSKEGINKNKWLIIDEINKADIDKAFGPFFSALSGDDVELGFKDDIGRNIEMILEENLAEGIESFKTENNQYIIPKDWRIIGTMNTFDKTSLYEMSYAFMRRFAFIPVAIPKDIDETLVNTFFDLWDIDIDSTKCGQIAELWKVINKYRKVGPAIIEDIGNFVSESGDYTSAVVIYILPQLEGLFKDEIDSFVEDLKGLVFIEDEVRLVESIEDFFNISLTGK